MPRNISIQPRLRAIENCLRDIQIIEEAMASADPHTHAEYLAVCEQDLVELRTKVARFEQEIEQQRVRNRARSAQQAAQRKERNQIKRLAAQQEQERRTDRRQPLSADQRKRLRAHNRAKSLHERLARYRAKRPTNPPYYDYRIDQAKPELRRLQAEWGMDIGVD